jgi:FkbM family methyltransferase
MTYNEAKNLPKMAESAKEYMDAGGKIYLFDTGSTDDTVEVAKKIGFHVTVSKVKFKKTLTKGLLNKWKTTFKMSCTPVATPTDFFPFDEARNAASKIPEEDCMFFVDGSDYFVNLDYMEVNKVMEEGYDQLTTIQLYGGARGGICRFYNRNYGKWFGHVHEHLVCDDERDFLNKDKITHRVKRGELSEEIFCIEHRIIQKDRSDKYMAGLLYTHLNMPTGRWHYYVARELMGKKYYADARRLFVKRYECEEYPEERAMAMCWAAKCKKEEGGTDDEVFYFYKKAYELETTLRESYFEFCQYHFLKKNWKEVLEGATKCVKIINESAPTFFEDYRFNEDHNLSWYLLHGHYYAGSKELAVYHWRKFVKSRNIVEEKNETYKTLNFAKYKYFPDIPLEIKEFMCKSIDGDEIYKCIGELKDDSIGNRIGNQASDDNTQLDTFLMDFTRKLTPPCTTIIDTSAGKGYYAIAVSKLVYPSTVHAFEVFSYKELVTNVFLNARNNVKTHEHALSNEESVINGHTIAIASSKVTYNDAVAKNYFNLSREVDNTIDCKALDSYMNIVSNVSVIKMEENGLTSPTDIIVGGMGIIKQHKPSIIILRGILKFNLNGIQQLLKPLGYTSIKTKNVELYVPDTISQRKRVAIVCYSAPEMIWDISHFEGKYIELGDSEYAVINLAKALSANGIIVDVWCNTSKLIREKNIRYLNYKFFQGYFDSSCYYDAVIYWRYDYEIRTKHKATKNILWLQEHNYGTYDERKRPDIDAVVVQSQNHRDTFLSHYKNDQESLAFFENKVHVIPNSIETRSTHLCVDRALTCNVNSIETRSTHKCVDRVLTCNANNIARNIADASQRIKHKCVYLNNRAYGLDILLDDWDNIHSSIPTATLHIIHGPQTWGIKTREEEKAMSDRILTLKDKGVYAQHTLTQPYLQSLLQACDFWLYPCPHEEAYNIQGVQAAYSGVIPIVSDQRFLRTLTPQVCSVWPLTDGNFGKKCIEIMSMCDDAIHDIRKTVETLGKIAFCDTSRQASMFESII